MPSYDTPEPILVNVEPEVGNVRIIAGDRTDTVVDVAPTDPANASDVMAAKQTVVDFSGGTLSVKGPKLRPLSLSKQTRSIEVTIEVPSGSRVQGSTGLGDLHTTGRLGECRYKSGLGHIQLDQVGELHLRTATGSVVIERVDGNADVSTSSGRVHVGAIAGTGVVKNSNGATTIGSAGHALRVRSANGDITVEHAEDGVEARTANGSVRVLDAARGAVTLESAMGDLEIGIREGTAAWLDVNTKFGRVRNDLASTGAPEPGTDKLEVRASTSFGDITVRRS
ncbi:DUF4097 family beta strand repeat-containing protein [Actinophytocola sp.]|uniref:DUF4097 family beta strand repeat-containing protein n=1 Tax=Actinophytocola sp. TaxID=1872138 RepID=UPI002D32DABD|nr:DUF4097 family beta strand repeat-containing protein [Actinophytocola sp.]HYQ69455.1 DUF4097 family beta strand repeat-containing protein [Actinophytocola sp.]